jgi:hypothetical protein
MRNSGVRDIALTPIKRKDARDAVIVRTWGAAVLRPYGDTQAQELA